MRYAMLFLAAATIAASPAISKGTRGGTVSVRGHVTRQGVFVIPHIRTVPNASRADNWSSTPNVNPITGKPGTKDPYAPPAPRP